VPFCQNVLGENGSELAYHRSVSRNYLKATILVIGCFTSACQRKSAQRTAVFSVGSAVASQATSALAAAASSPPKISEALLQASCALEASQAKGQDPSSANVQSGSTVAFAAIGANEVVLVADEDARQLRAIDLGQAKEVDKLDLGSPPAQILPLHDGRIAIALPQENLVAVAAASDKGLRLLCTRAVAEEPVALAAANDGSVVVTSRWGQRLTVLDASFASQREVALPRDPYAVSVNRKGMATVSHAFGGRVSVVDIRTGKVRPLRMVEQQTVTLSVDDEPALVERIGTQAYAAVAIDDGSVAIPFTAVDPGDKRFIESTAYYGGRLEIPIMSQGIALFARGDASPKISLVTRACLLPRAAAWDSAEKTLLVACRGADNRVIGYRLEKDGNWNATIERRVANGVSGIAVKPGTRQAVAWSQFDAAIDVVPLDDASAARGIQLDKRYQVAPEVALGRRLFHSTGARRISADGRACASCHPDGRDDGLTWITSEGPRQTPMLLQRLDNTAPYGWTGSKGDLDGYVARTIRRLGGSGLSAPERGALIAYIRSLKPPSLREKQRTPLETRGQELFAAAETKCATCHVGDDLADGIRHDVGSGDSVKDFDTPSLRFVAQSAPYFHDGRYDSIEDMLRDDRHKMGNVTQLGDEDVKALAAYLRTL
jgi:mono/diheme cytochrome c family protein